jgi:hypothetical protein
VCPNLTRNHGHQNISQVLAVAPHNSLDLFGGVLGFAQTKAAQPNKPSAHDQVLKQFAPKKDWIKDPNKVMPMRQMTNTQRRAAAQRNQARRAKVEAQKLSTPANQGVQQ